MGLSELQHEEKYCIARRGTSWFAVPALSVREVSPADSMVPIPEAPPVLAGLCHLRHEFLPVLHLCCTVSREDPVLNRSAQLLVVTGVGGAWALQVDEVAGLASLDVSVDVDARSPDDWTAAVMGSATYRNEVVRVLDPNRFYRLAERELRDSRASATRHIGSSASAVLAEGEGP